MNDIVVVPVGGIQDLGADLRPNYKKSIKNDQVFASIIALFVLRIAIDMAGYSYAESIPHGLPVGGVRTGPDRGRCAMYFVAQAVSYLLIAYLNFTWPTHAHLETSGVRSQSQWRGPSSCSLSQAGCLRAHSAATSC